MMKARACVSLVVPLLIATAIGLAAQTPPPQVQRDRPTATPMPTGTASITGRVLILQNGQPAPVRRARVTLEASVLARTVRVDTDVEGRFQFNDLPAGSYRVVVDKAGFVPAMKDPRRAFERPVAIEIKDGQAASVEVAMQQAAAVEGTVLIDAGQPAMNVVVTAQRFIYDATGRHLAPVQQVRTDDRGRFRVHTLPPGEYYIEAGPDPLDLLNGPATAEPPAPVLAHTFYPGTPYAAEARMVPLAVGQNVSDIDIRLTRVAVVTVKGGARLSSGAPPKDVYFRIQRVGGPVGEVRGWSLPDGSEFEFPAVPTGDYWLMAVARSSPGSPLEFAAAPVRVGTQSMSGVIVTTAKGASTVGHVEVEGGQSPLPPNLRVVAHETEYSLPTFPGLAPPTTDGRVDEAGAFTFTSLFGPRLFRVEGLPATWALKAVLLDDQDVTDLATDFQAGERSRVVRLVITTRTATLRGTVEDNAGRPVARARVVLFSADERHWQPRSRMVRAVETGLDGHFTIEGALVGNYVIAAVPYLEDESWTDANVLRGLRNIAAQVDLKDGAPATIALKVR